MLLKSSGGLLPLSATDSSIAVIGDDAGPEAITSGGGAHVVSRYMVIRSRASLRPPEVAPRSPALRGPGHPPVDRNQTHAIHLQALMIEPTGSSGRTGADYQAHLALVYSSERRACNGDGDAGPRRSSATRATGSNPPTGPLKTSLKFDRTGDDRYASDEGQDVGRSLSRANSRECPGHNEH